MRHKLTIGLLTLLAIFFITPGEVRAATLRVPQDYSTMMLAYDAATHGDTILVAPGTYDVCLTGNRTKRIILRAQNPATTSPTSQQTILNSTCSHVIQFNTPLDNDGIFQPGEVVEFIGFVLNGSDDGFSYEGASGIVKDNIISGQGDDPIDIDGGSEAHIIGNILTNGGNDGIENRLHGFSSSRIIQMIFRNNIIYNSNDDGIQLIYQGAGNSKRKYLIANNLIIGNGQVGIGTSPDTRQNSSGYPFQEQMYVLNNTFVNNGWGGILGGANMKVHNNIFYNNKVAAVKNVSGNSIASHNLFFGNDADYVNSNNQSPNVLADPNFVNTSLPPNFSSYQLGSGSPAIDAGKVVDSYYADFGVTPPGYSGNAPDLGWIESGLAPPPTPTAGPSPTPTPTSPPGIPTPTQPPPGCSTSSSSWQNFSMSNQTGSFTVEYDATPNGSGIDALTMLSQGAGSAWSDYAALVRFNPSGGIDARNGGSYSADTTINYSANTTYHFRLEIDVPAKRYSVYVTPPGSSPQLLANNYAFRSEQSGVTSINNWGIRGAVGSHQVCNFQLGGGTPAITAKAFLVAYGTTNSLLDQVVDGLVNLLDWLKFLNPTTQPTPTGFQPTTTPTRTPTPTPSGPTPTSHPVQGIWTSPGELAGKPMLGTEWNYVKSMADSSFSPDIEDQNSSNDVAMLAAAIVYARTGDGSYRGKVQTALEQAVSRYGNCAIGNRTLAWARNMAAYPMAADLIGYRTSSFEQFLRDMADQCIGSQLDRTLRQMFTYMPNNWGGLGFGSLAAIYSYLGDTTRLQELRREWVEEYLLNLNNVNASVHRSWANDSSWHIDSNNLRVINPVGSIKQGIDISGVVPEDQQRKGGFTTSRPSGAGYPWDYLSGIAVGARVLDRAGMPIWHEGDDALYRATYRYKVIWNFSYGIDNWVVPFINYHYSNRPPIPDTGRNRGWGWQAGYPYVLP